MLFISDLVNFFGNIVGQNGTQVARMVSVAATLEDITHVLVYVIDSCNYWGNETTSGHHDIDIFKRNAF